MNRHSRPPHPDVATYPEAVRWLRSAWTTLPVAPQAIHSREIEELSQLGSHRFSAGMWRVLADSPYATEEATEESECRHEAQSPARRRAGDICPTCGIYDGEGKLIAERGTLSRSRYRYRSPMAAALSSLSRGVPPPPGRPSSVDVIVALAWSGWHLPTMAEALGMPIVSDDHRKTLEAMVLMHVRKLYSRYSSGPVARGPKWSELSDSQQNAIVAA